jgi:lipopolysaccharide transport system ATP-binding protein
LKVEANEEIKLDLKFSINLGVGHYSIAVAIHADHSHVSKNYEWRDLALLFEVINTDKDEFVGVGWLPPTMEYHR